MLSFTTSDFLIRPFSDGNFFVLVDGEEIDSVNYENKIIINFLILNLII